jgi:hypothetical protein
MSFSIKFKINWSISSQALSAWLWDLSAWVFIFQEWWMQTFIFFHLQIAFLTKMLRVWKHPVMLSSTQIKGDRLWEVAMNSNLNKRNMTCTWHATLIKFINTTDLWQDSKIQNMRIFNIIVCVRRCEKLPYFLTLALFFIND